MRKQIVINRYSKYNYKLPSWYELKPTITTSQKRAMHYKIKKHNIELRVKHILTSYISDSYKENRMTIALINEYFSYCKLPNSSYTEILLKTIYRYKYAINNLQQYNNTLRYVMPSLLTDILFSMRRYIMYKKIQLNLLPKLNNLDSHKAIQLYPYPVMLREQSCIKLMDKVLDVLDDCV